MDVEVNAILNSRCWELGDSRYLGAVDEGYDDRKASIKFDYMQTERAHGIVLEE